jgi:hypothetical protein
MEKRSPESQLLLDEYLVWQDFGGVVVLSPEWGVDVPLWPNSEAVLQLVPEPLLAKLIAWQSIFDSNYTWDGRGWSSDETKGQWEQEALLLVDGLLIVLKDKAELVVDLWPMFPREQNRQLQEYMTRRQAESERWREALEEAGIRLEWRFGTNDEVGRRANSSDDGEVT